MPAGFWIALKDAFTAARVAYNKSRYLPPVIPSGAPDPSVVVGEEHGMGLTPDEPVAVVYKTEGGRYFTESMLKNEEFAKTLAGCRIIQAVSMDDEYAEHLADMMDAMMIDGYGFTDGEMLLLKMIRKKLREKWAK